MYFNLQKNNIVMKKKEVNYYINYIKVKDDKNYYFNLNKVLMFCIEKYYN